MYLGCRTQILEEIENDDILSDHIFLSQPELDIYLDDKAIFLCSHILEKYFSMDTIRELLTHTMSNNTYERAIADQKNSAARIPMFEIKREIGAAQVALDSADSSEWLKGQAVDIIKIFTDELKRREGEFPFTTVRRYVEYMKKWHRLKKQQGRHVIDMVAESEVTQ